MHAYYFNDLKLSSRFKQVSMSLMMYLREAANRKTQNLFVSRKIAVSLNGVDCNKKSHPKESGLVKSGAEWIRTTDSRIFSPMLYQLSYSTKFWVGKSRYFFEKAKFKLKFVAGIF